MFRGSCMHRFLRSGILTSKRFYVLEDYNDLGVITFRRSYVQRFLRPRVLTFFSSYVQGFLCSRILTLRCS